jgi:hypothetical protein
MKNEYFKFSEILRCIDLVADFSKQYSAFIFTVKRSFVLHRFTLQDERTTPLRSVGYHSILLITPDDLNCYQHCWQNLKFRNIYGWITLFDHFILKLCYFRVIMEYGTKYMQAYDTNDLPVHNDSSESTHSSDRIRDFMSDVTLTHKATVYATMTHSTRNQATIIRLYNKTNDEFHNSANQSKANCNGWTCRAVRVLPHTKSANTACTKRSWWWTGEVRNMSS